MVYQLTKRIKDDIIRLSDQRYGRMGRVKRAFLIFWKNYRSAIIKIFAIVLIVLFYRCPANKIFGIDCPGCGLTRACLSALRFDFKSAFEYHPLFWLFGAGLLYFVFYEQIKRRVKIKGKIELVVLLCSAALFVTVWLIRVVF